MNGEFESSKEHPLPLETVGNLIDLLIESGVGEISVRQGETEITVKAKSKASSSGIPIMEKQSVEPPTEPESKSSLEQDRLHTVRSPIVGTFYRAAAPGEDPYVSVGDQVSIGQTLCIVEAMKLMNLIPADVSGEVVEVLVENGQGVQYDQPLFYIRSDI